MWKFMNRLLFSGLAFVLTVAAMTNLDATSMFMMYEPEPPEVINSKS